LKFVAAILLFALAGVTQPAAAQPEKCGLPAVACAACCAVDPCCTLSSSDQTAPQSHAISVSPEHPVLSRFVHATAIVRGVRPSGSRATALRQAGDIRHSPPPLALNCVQLI